MNKREFLEQLKKELSGLPQSDIEDRLTFYGEMIDDRTEEGMTESEAVSGVGTVKEVAAQILADIPLGRIVKEKVKPNRTLKAWEIVLLILGSPVWLSLLIAACAVIIAVYAAIWSVAAALWSADVSFAAGSLGAAVSAVFFAVRGDGIAGIAVLAAVFFLAGLSIFLFFGCRAATKGIITLTGKIALGVKTMFVGKEKVQ